MENINPEIAFLKSQIELLIEEIKRLREELEKTRNEKRAHCLLAEITT